MQPQKPNFTTTQTQPFSFLKTISTLIQNSPFISLNKPHHYHPLISCHVVLPNHSLSLPKNFLKSSPNSPFPPRDLSPSRFERRSPNAKRLGSLAKISSGATWLESMVDFSTSKLGKEVMFISTEAEREMNLKPFMVVNLVKKSPSRTDSVVVCHKLSYPSAVFYCHFTQHTRAYEISLVGAGRTKADVAAVCHTNTSAWNPKHLAFQVLKVKPGTVPVCHFLPQDHVAWVSKY